LYAKAVKRHGRSTGDRNFPQEELRKKADPLTIGGQEGRSGETPVRQWHSLETVQASSEQLSAMISDVDDLGAVRGNGDVTTPRDIQGRRANWCNREAGDTARSRARLEPKGRGAGCDEHHRNDEGDESHHSQRPPGGRRRSRKSSGGYWLVRDEQRRRDVRDIASESGIARPVDLAHAAGAEGADDFIRPEASAC
jgi:hypothetical protein